MDLPTGRYLLRNAFKMTLFRHDDANTADWTYFAYQQAPSDTDRLPEWLQGVLNNRQYGRYLRWSPLKEPRTYEEHCFLMLRNEGTGRAYIDGRHFAITWSHREIAGDVVSLGAEQANALAEHVFNKFVNTMLEDPYITPENRNEPIEFICGSQQELERITRWICYTEPDLFATGESVSIDFSSSSMDELEPDTSQAGPDRFYHDYSDRMMTLLGVAYEYNSFLGGYREYRDYNDRYRLSGNELYPEGITVDVSAPSAHERAEAWLELAEWLNGKLPEAERKALLAIKRE